MLRRISWEYENVDYVTRADIVLIAVLVAFAGAGFILVPRAAGVGGHAVVEVEGRRVLDLPLDRDTAVTVTGTCGESVIVVERGSAQRKMVVAGSPFVPNTAVLDPALTVGMPPWLTAASGMDALSHAVEELLSPRRHAFVAALALEAARRIAMTLPRVFRQPDDLDARQVMLEAAMMAGVGFEKGLGAVHSLSHAIGAVFPLHHGILNAVLLPAGLELNRGHCPEGVPCELAAAVGLPAGTDETAIDALAEWTRALARDLELPPRLRDLDGLGGDRDNVIERALLDHCHRTNPRACGRDEFVELWERAW